MADRSMFLSPKILKLDKTNRKLIKGADINISSRKRRYYRKEPKRILSIIKNKEKVIEKEIDHIVKATSINAMAPLAQLSQVLPKDATVDLIKFNSDGNSARAVFKAKTSKRIIEFNKYVSSLGIRDKSITYKKGSKSTLLSFSVKGK